MNNNKQYRFTLFTNRDCTIENTPGGRRRVFKFLMNMGSRLEQNKEYRMTLESIGFIGIYEQDLLVIRCPNVMSKYFWNNTPESAPIIYAGPNEFSNKSLDLYSFDVDANIMMNEFTLILDGDFQYGNNPDIGIHVNQVDFAITFILTEYRDE